MIPIGLKRIPNAVPTCFEFGHERELESNERTEVDNSKWIRCRRLQPQPQLSACLCLRIHRRHSLKVTIDFEEDDQSIVRFDFGQTDFYLVNVKTLGQLLSHIFSLYHHSAGNLSRTSTRNGGFFVPRTSPSHLPENCRQYGTYTYRQLTGKIPAKCPSTSWCFFGKNNSFLLSRSPAINFRQYGTFGPARFGLLFRPRVAMMS